MMLLRGAESIRMIYIARAGTFFCIFCWLARVSVGLRSMLCVGGPILPNKFFKNSPGCSNRIFLSLNTNLS